MDKSVNEIVVRFLSDRWRYLPSVSIPGFLHNLLYAFHVPKTTAVTGILFSKNDPDNYTGDQHIVLDSIAGLHRIDNVEI